MNAQELARSVAAAVPELAPLLAEHVADNDELLPHVFFGDVTRWAESQPAGSPDLAVLLGVLATAYRDGDPSARNVVTVSFLEHLDPRVRAVLPPSLADLHPASVQPHRPWE